jgi:hypothetical protein
MNMSNLAAKTEKDCPIVEVGKKAVYLSDLTTRFRIILEEGSERGSDNLNFCQLIPCAGFRSGPGQSGPFIALHSEDPPILMLYSDRIINGKSIWNAIKKHPETSADFHLDGEMVLFFPPSCLEVVGQMAGARKKRTLTEEQKERLRLGRERVGLVRDERGRLVHVQVQDSPRFESPGPQAMENHAGGVQSGF